MVLKRWAIILGVLAIVLYGAFWAATHPNNPIASYFAVGVIVFLAFVRIMGWLKIPSSVADSSSKSREPSDPIYLELRTLFREKLLPLNFQEEEVYDIGFVVTYRRGQSNIQLSRQQHSNGLDYTFSTSNPYSIVHKMITMYNTQGEQVRKKFKAEAIDKFEQWLAKQ